MSFLQKRKNNFTFLLVVVFVISCGGGKIRRKDTYASKCRRAYKEPIEYCTKALAETYNKRGFMKLMAKDYQGAIEDHTKAIEIVPQESEAYYNRAIAKADSKDEKGAIADYKKAVLLDQKHPKIYYSCRMKNVLKDYKGAIKDCTKAIKEYPLYSEAYYNRGIAYEKLGDKKKAEKDFKKYRRMYW